MPGGKSGVLVNLWSSLVPGSGSWVPGCTVEVDQTQRCPLLVVRPSFPQLPIPGSSFQTALKYPLFLETLPGAD